MKYSTSFLVFFFLSIQDRQEKKTNKQRKLVHHNHLLYGSDTSVKIIFPISST